MQDKQIERQEKIIISLRNELQASLRRSSESEGLKQLASEGQAVMAQKQSVQQRLTFVEVELAKQRELAALHERVAAEAQQQVIRPTSLRNYSASHPHTFPLRTPSGTAGGFFRTSWSASVEG